VLCFPCTQTADATVSLVYYGGEASKYRVLNLTSTATDERLLHGVRRRHVRPPQLPIVPPLVADAALRRAAPFVPSNAKLGLTLVKEPADRAPLPEGARGAYHHPKTAVMYGPGAGGMQVSALLLTTSGRVMRWSSSIVARKIAGARLVETEHVVRSKNKLQCCRRVCACAVSICCV
jgi:hypothetical protein